VSLKKIEEIIKEVEEDLTITMDNLDKKLYQIPKLHSKYLKYFYEYSKVLITLEKDLKKCYREKYYYYTFEHNKKLENAKEVEFHIISDDDYAPILERRNKAKAIVDVLDRAVNKVDKLSFDVKNIIDYLKYSAGV
jgi:hypothetical protein